MVERAVLEAVKSQFESEGGYQISGVSIMDNTVGFYPSNGSSILSRRTNQASMVKLVDTGDLKSPAFGRAGSNPATRTIFYEGVSYESD